MTSALHFKELENEVVSATYCNLMIGAKIVLVESGCDMQLQEPIASIQSPAPNGMVRLRLPASFRPGTYYLRALNAHGESVAESAAFRIGWDRK